MSELERWGIVIDQYVTIEEFIEFLSSSGYWIHTSQHNFPLTISDIRKLIFKHLDIDTTKLEAERRKLLESVTQNAHDQYLKNNSKGNEK